MAEKDKRADGDARSKQAEGAPTLGGRPREDVEDREHFTLVLENGQAFSADDISELLSRPDSPFR